MKCFKRLVKDHINTIIPDTLQFEYRPNRSTDDAISIALHTVLSHMDKRNSYVRMLFIDYSSAFNTIVLSKLITKLKTQGLNISHCNWILDFLLGPPLGWEGGNNTPLSGACLVPSCTLCSPMTVGPHMTPIPSLRLLTT